MERKRVESRNKTVRDIETRQVLETMNVRGCLVRNQVAIEMNAERHVVGGPIPFQFVGRAGRNNERRLVIVFSRSNDGNNIGNQCNPLSGAACRPPPWDQWPTNRHTVCGALRGTSALGNIRY